MQQRGKKEIDSQIQIQIIRRIRNLKVKNKQITNEKKLQNFFF